MKSFLISLIAVLILGTSWCIAQTQRINFAAPGVYPEGIAYDAATDVFYLSSVRIGTVGKLTPSGVYSMFYKDNSLKSTFGMKVDPIKKILWVCAGDPNYSQFRDSSTFRKSIRLIGIDLNSGTKVNDIDLSKLFSGKHFPNDISIDKDGNIYMTDSFSPVIYKIDNKGSASVFAQSNLFATAGVGLNGIVWHPSGFLLVANNGNGNVLKVDLKNPTQVSKVKIDQFFPGADGLLLDKQNNLLLVQNKGVNKVFKIATTDNWVNGKVIAATESKAMFNFPSTTAIRQDKIWVVNAKLNELSDSTSVLSKKFSIQEAVLVAEK